MSQKNDPTSGGSWYRNPVTGAVQKNAPRQEAIPEPVQSIQESTPISTDPRESAGTQET